MIASSPGSSAAGALPALVWLLWALAAAVSVQLAPNPLYVLLVVAICVLVVQAHGAGRPLASAFPVLLVAGALFAGVRLALTALTTHGTGDVLFTLPEVTLPKLLGGFDLGGSVEAPVVARAAAEGWAIVGIIAAFAAFNAVVSHAELVQSAPRAFHELGLAVTVALAFVPATIAAVVAVREADLARTGGRVVRRGRLLRQVVPVLEGGLERAVSLAESMDSRGFARDASREERAAGWLGLLSLLTLAASFVALVGHARTVAAVMAAGGAVALVAAVAVASRSSARVRYRPRRIPPQQWAIAALAWVAPAGLAVLAAAGEETLRWPQDVLTTPSIGLVPVAVLASLAIAPLARGTRA